MRRPMFTPGWLALHVLTVVLAVAFVALGWWQLQRGEAGNMRSFAYALEWPLFAVFVVFMWWRLLHDGRRTSDTDDPDDGEHADDPTGRTHPVGRPVVQDGDQDRALPRVLAARARAVPAPGEAGDPADERLAAYNRYLAELDARDGRPRAQRSGPGDRPAPDPTTPTGGGRQ